MVGIDPIAEYELPTRAQLPANQVQWKLEPERSVLLIHDMQEYFVSMLPQALRSRLVENCVDLKRRCHEKGVPAFYTAQPGGMNDQERGLLKNFWGRGMSTDPNHKRIVRELTPAHEDTVLTKWRYSAFVSSDLLERLRADQRDQMIICGVYGHVGIIATAVEAFSYDIQPFLAADAIGDFSAAHLEGTLRYATERCGVVVTAEEVYQ